MATHDYVIANGTGAAVRSDLNDALAAIVSNNSSSSEPATTYAYQWWADTTNNVLKIRNSANNAWITLRELDGTLLMEDGSASAPGLSFASDTNTGFFSGGADKIGFAAGGAERLEIGSSEVVFNDPSNDVDFRVESNGQTHMLFVDAGNDRIGIAENSPSSLLSLGTSLSDFKLKLYDGGDANDYGFGVQSGVLNYHSGGAHVFEKGGSEKARIDSSGRLLVGTSSARTNYENSNTYGPILNLEGTSNSNRVLSFIHNDNSGGPFLALGSTGGSAAGSNTLVAAQSTLGFLSFQGADGTDLVAAARIKAQVDGTPGANDMPGRLVFETTADGASSPTERVRIDSSGRVGIGSSSPVGQTYISGPNVSTFGVAADAALNLAAAGGALVNRVVNLNFAVVDSATNAAAAIGMKYTSQSGFGKGDLIFGTRDVTTDTAPTERMRIDSSGNVGIGTSVPSFASGGGLEVSQSSGRSNVYATSGSATLQLSHDGSTAQVLNRHNSDLQFGTNNTERARLDSSGRLLIGTSSDQGGHLVQVKGGDVSLTKLAEASGGNAVQMLRFRVNNSNNTAQSASLGGISAETLSGWGGILTFHTKEANGSPNETVTERMRIDNSGNVLTGTTSTTVAALSSAGVGHRVSPSGIILQVASNASQTAAFNRTGTDGSVIGIRQNGTEEGLITVSGSTVSYLGGHLSRWSQLAGNAERIEILRGTVLSNLDEMCEWTHAAQDAVLYTEEDELPEGVSVGDVKTPAVDAYSENNEQLNRMKVSDVEGDVNVAGIFQSWDDDDDTFTNDLVCAMTGDFVIRIAQGTTVARGDLLMSAGDGTAKPQDDDIVRSKTIAKVTSTTVSTTYADGSYCVPCVLMAC